MNTQLQVPERTAASSGVAGLATAARDARQRSGEGLVVALIPVHDEEGQIEQAIRSLDEQESPPDLIVVCADNCTDATPETARSAGAYVFETMANRHKKAGALNQALEVLLPELRDEDAVLVMDADSVLEPTFLVQARNHLRDGVGGVGGVFTGPLGRRVRRNASHCSSGARSRSSGASRSRRSRQRAPRRRSVTSSLPRPGATGKGSGARRHASARACTKETCSAGCPCRGSG